MKLNKPILFILILSLSVSLFTIYQRADAERPYNKVELVADYGKYKKLGHDMGMDMEKVLKNLKDAGVTTVAIKEESLEEIKKSGRITIVNLWELSEKNTITGSLEPVIREVMDSNLDPSGTVVVIPNNAEDYEWIKEPLKNRAAGFKDWSKDGAYVLTFSGRYEDLEDFTLGFDFSKFEQAKNLGLNISVRPSNYMEMTPDYIRSLFEKFREYPVTSVIFNGVQVLGYPYNLEVTANMVKETGIVIGPIETWTQLMHIEQKGLNSLIELADYKAVRVFSLNEAEANKVSFKEVMDRWFRAVDERNLRLVYLNPKEEKFMSPAENFETNLFYIKQFVEVIQNRGFVIGRVVPMKDFNIGRTRMLVLLAGVIAGALLLLDNMFRIRKSYLYGLFAVGMVLGQAMLHVMPSLADKAFALGAAIVFPSLAMIYILQLCRRIIEEQTGEAGLARIVKASVAELLKASGISLIGAAFVASMLSSTAYLLELDVFRGVKIAHIIPLAVFVIAYFIIIGYRRDEFGSIWKEIKALLDVPITVKYVLLIGIIAVGGYLYLGRTGHTAGAPIFGLEVKIRTLLEQALVARPRTKEFLVAHPAMILMIAGVLKKYKSIILPLGLAGAIGQISMVNSFSHLRTPLYMSAYRTAYGLAIGIVLGIIGIIFLWMVVHIYNARRRTKDV
ncbi:MAG: hypothetical protein HPY66_1984 [Firmicutes bacterium]|nr:hypothetical protein [Bacillota bacterium]MDI6705242.1 DUF5693 family protein [Bacillota bacterium]